MFMKPLKDMLLIGEKAKEETTASGLIIAGADVNTGSKPGVVLAVGPDVNEVDVGDTIAVKWSEAMALTVEGQQVALVSQEFVYGVY
jgi:co-chaperonin GroES (HSP10)